MRIAITGRPGVGKTTLIERVLNQLSISAGGMLTTEIRKCGHRVGFSVIAIDTKEEGILAHLHQTKGPRMGQYTVNLDDLEGVGISAILRAVQGKELVVIDELAPMELSSPAFIPAVEEALASGKNLIISTHAHLNHPLIHRIRREFTLYRVKMGNRDQLVKTIIDAFGSLSV